MSDLNVAFRLSLINQMKAGADAAKRDLQSLKAEAEKLNKANAGFSPAAMRAARQLEQIEARKAMAVERTSASYRRQRTEMMASDMAARRLDRAREVRQTREAARIRRESRSIQSATAAAAVANSRAIEWANSNRAFRSAEAARRQRTEMMASTLAATRMERAAEARALRDAQLGRPGARAGAGAGGRGILPGGAAAGAAGGMAVGARSAGFGVAKSFIGGLGAGIGVAGLAQFVKESLFGAAGDEFERDQLRVLGSISDAQMKVYQKELDRVAKLRGLGSQGALGIFGGLMAGGLTPQEAAAMTDSVSIFSKATQASTQDASATAVALRNNMGLTSAKDIMAAFDAINVGGKAGEFEVSDMARYLPQGLAGMRGLGETGITGVRNTVAMLQAVRKGTGTSAEAMTQFYSMLTEFTSPNFIKKAGEIGINIEQTMANAEKNGLSPVFAVLHEIEKKTKGDKFKLGELITNTTSAAAVRSILRDMGFVVDVLEEMDKAGGSTMSDYETATGNATEAWKRFTATIMEGSKSIVGSALPAITQGLDGVTNWLNTSEQRAGGLLGKLDEIARTIVEHTVPDPATTPKRPSDGRSLYSDMIKPLVFGEAYEKRLKKAYQVYAQSRVAGQNPRSLRSPVPAREAERDSLAAYNRLVNSGDMADILDEAREERKALIEARKQREARSARESAAREANMPGNGSAGLADDGTPMPYSNKAPIMQRMLEGMRNPAGAASDAMNEYNDALGKGLDQAKSQIASAVAEFRSMLNFSAGPTIVPSALPVGAGAGANQQASAGSTSVTQNISTSDPRLAARRAQREQNRATNLALANALHETGMA